MSTTSEPAASPAVVEAPASPAPSMQEVVDKLDDAQRAKWKETGELPEPEKKAEGGESAPPKEPPAPEPGKEVKKEEAAPAASDAEKRKSELGREIQDLLERRAALDRELREREERLSAVSAKKPEEEAKAPKPEDFKGENAYDEYLAAMVTYKAQQVAKETLATERAKQEKEDRARQEQAEQERYKASWLDNVKAAEKAHPDFRQVALDPKVIEKVTPGSTLDLYVAQMPHGRETLYQLAKNQAKLDEIVAIKNPMEQAFAIRDFERELLAQQAPPKKVSDAPPPPKDAGGAGAKPDDVVDVALADGDVSSYMREMNKRELAKQKGA